MLSRSLKPLYVGYIGIRVSVKSPRVYVFGFFVVVFLLFFMWYILKLIQLCHPLFQKCVLNCLYLLPLYFVPVVCLKLCFALLCLERTILDSHLNTLYHLTITKGQTEGAGRVSQLCPEMGIVSFFLLCYFNHRDALIR